MQCPARSINELTLILFPLFVNNKQCQLIRNVCHFFLWELHINLNINNQFHVCQYWKTFTSPQASLEIPTNEMENLNWDINRHFYILINPSFRGTIIIWDPLIITRYRKASRCWGNHQALTDSVKETGKRPHLVASYVRGYCGQVVGCIVWGLALTGV